jgi:hypothetical protein
MKRKPINHNKTPNYPSFKAFHKNRREFLGTLGLGAAGLALTSSCTRDIRDGGVMPIPDDFPGMDGDMPIPEISEPQTAGIPAEPKQPEPPERLGGKTAPAKQPHSMKNSKPKAKQQTPTLRGRAPQPQPTKEKPADKNNQRDDFPELGGDIAISELPKKEKPQPTPRLMGLICSPQP